VVGGQREGQIETEKERERERGGARAREYDIASSKKRGSVREETIPLYVYTSQFIHICG